MRYHYTVRQRDQREDEALQVDISETDNLEQVFDLLRPLLQESRQNNIRMNLTLDWGTTHYTLHTYF